MKINKLMEKMPCPTGDLYKIWEELLVIRKELIIADKKYDYKNHQIIETHISSARNLIQYLALRQHDIRNLQLDLTNWGISSLGRVERKVQANVDTVLMIISHLINEEWKPNDYPPICFSEARARLEENSTLLLGKMPAKRRARIMVTMPTSASYDFDLVYELMKSGMNVARINCAHDHEQVWLDIINNIRKAERLLGKNCIIHMDLGGPKLRTGPIQPQDSVIKIKPSKNDFGRVTDPAFAQFKVIADDDYSEAGIVPISSINIEKLHKGQTLKFKDARNSKRTILVTEVSENCFTGLIPKTSYFIKDLPLRDAKTGETIAIIGSPPPMEGALLCKVGDIIELYRDDIEGQNQKLIIDQSIASNARLSCTLKEALENVKSGERIWFDDGKIEGIIEGVHDDFIEIKVLAARPQGTKLKSEKGINLPDSDLKFPALTEKDIKDLDFVVAHADTVGLSFANRPKDVRNLIDELKKRTNTPPGIILKIETVKGFYNLPRMLLEAMSVPSCGVMIARGDLAIECGFGRLAEVQEQILWISEAAHVPVIWATQVLESLAKTGFQTRAEVTDAAMGQRAECIMLNKGEHIVKATAALDEILERMQDHQTKKRSKHRKLKLAEDFFKEDNMFHA